MSGARSPSAAWLAGLATGAVPLAALARWSGLDARWLPLAFAAVGLSGALWPLLRARDADRPEAAHDGERRAAFRAGFGAGACVAIALALRLPFGWIHQDVCWHAAKIAVAAGGNVLDDPILRVPTVYPFLFSALLALPVAAGLSVPAALLGATAVSLVGALWGFWWLARAFLAPRAAALAQLALPLFFYYPLAANVLLPTPFNLSIGCAFAGLGLLARGSGASAERVRPRLLVAAGLLLGCAGLLWYAHLMWIAAAALLWCAARPRGARWLALGALAPAATLALHVLLLARAGSLGGTGITGGAPPADASARLLGMARNLMSSSGATPLADVPAWIGPSLALACLLAWARRAPPRPARRDDPAGDRVAPAGLLWRVGVPLAACLVWGGLRLTYWDAFSWRYLFLLESLLVVFVASARPLRLGAIALPPVALLAALALVAAPRWMLNAAALSEVASARQLGRSAPISAFLAAHTAQDEPVFASHETWEQAVALGTARPGFVDRHGGTYKYAPARHVAARWRDLQALTRATDARAAAALLAPYGFRWAVVSEKDRARPGFAALATGFEIALDGGYYVVLDLTRPL